MSLYNHSLNVGFCHIDSRALHMAAASPILNSLFTAIVKSVSLLIVHKFVATKVF